MTGYFAIMTKIRTEKGCIPYAGGFKTRNINCNDPRGEFYDIKKDVYERTPIPDNELTSDEKALKASFAAVLGSMHN